MVIDSLLLDKLTAQAKESPRLRMNLDLRNSDGDLEGSYELSAGGPICALNIPAGQWHTLRALESGAVILEMKDGAYEPIIPADIL